jgi:hypothetical protein
MVVSEFAYFAHSSGYAVTIITRFPPPKTFRRTFPKNLMRLIPLAFIFHKFNIAVLGFECSGGQ